MFRWINIRVCLVYFVVIFLSSFALLELHEIGNVPRNINVELPFDQSVCNNINSITTEDETITIRYTNTSISKVKNPEIYFALRTSWLNKEIFFPPGSGKFIDSEVLTHEISINFFLPIIDEYDGVLYCIKPKNKTYHKFKNMKEDIISAHKIHLVAKEYSKDADYSRLIVHNKNHWTERWCEGHNIPLFDSTFFFLSPAFFEFPQPFLVPGPRAPPFDKEIDRFTFEPIVIQFTKYNIPKDLINESRVVYYYGVYHNSFMLWHAFFDFIVPLYRFIKEYGYNETFDQRLVYVKSDGTLGFDDYIKCLTLNQILLTHSLPYPYLFETCFLGIKKYETNPDENRPQDYQVSFSYNFDNNSAPEMRNDILKANGLSVTKNCDNGKPYVIFIDRKSGRNINNPDEVFDLLKSKCPFCSVERVRAEDFSKIDQLKKFSRSSVIVGLHGSGLTNVVLMSQSRKGHPTHLVEFLPYNYSCRPWYKTASDVARVHYHSVMNKLPNEELRKKMEWCWAEPERCPTLECHDSLRDQKFSVELDTLEEEYIKIVDDLRSTVCTN